MDFGNKPDLCGDIDNDGDVDLVDLCCLSEEWLALGMMYDSDIAGADGPDGVVDMYDFSCLAGNWGVAENIIEYDEGFETGDFTNLPWEHDGGEPWTIDASISFEGTYSAKSGISSYDDSILRLTTDCGEGNLIFMLKMDGPGELFLRLDDTNYFVNELDYGENMDWTMVRYPVEAGTHTFQWDYDPDGFGDNAAAWIDGIRFPDLN